MISSTDPLSRTTISSYDSQHNLTTRRNPDGTAVGYSYDANGNATSFTDERSKSIHMTYNQFGSILTTTDALGNVRSTTYTNYEPAVFTAALGLRASFGWDTHNNLLNTNLGDGRISRYTYDSYGNRIAESDPLSNTTSYTYDQLGHPLSMTDPLSHSAYYSYDPLGREQGGAKAGRRMATPFVCLCGFPQLWLFNEPSQQLTLWWFVSGPAAALNYRKIVSLMSLPSLLLPVEGLVDDGRHLVAAHQRLRAVSAVRVAPDDAASLHRLDIGVEDVGTGNLLWHVRRTAWLPRSRADGQIAPLRSVWAVRAKECGSQLHHPP